MQNLHAHSVFCDGKNTPEEMIRACLAAGMDAFVAKPINGRELGRALSAFAEPRPARVS